MQCRFPCIVFQTTLEMMSTDQVSELRAEVTQWWDAIQQAHRQRQRRYEAEQAAAAAAGGNRSRSNTPNSVLTPILGAMLGEGPIRMITLGQELTVEMDEKTLSEVAFKDNQVSLILYCQGLPSPYFCCCVRCLNFFVVCRWCLSLSAQAARHVKLMALLQRPTCLHHQEKRYQ